MLLGQITRTCQDKSQLRRQHGLQQSQEQTSSPTSRHHRVLCPGRTMSLGEAVWISDNYSVCWIISNNSKRGVDVPGCDIIFGNHKLLFSVWSVLLVTSMHTKNCKNTIVKSNLLSLLFAVITFSLSIKISKKSFSVSLKGRGKRLAAVCWAMPWQSWYSNESKITIQAAIDQEAVKNGPS